MNEQTISFDGRTAIWTGAQDKNEFEKITNPYAVLYGFQRNFEGEKEVKTFLFHHKKIYQKQIPKPLLLSCPYKTHPFIL